MVKVEARAHNLHHEQHLQRPVSQGSTLLLKPSRSNDSLLHVRVGRKTNSKSTKVSATLASGTGYRVLYEKWSGYRRRYEIERQKPRYNDDLRSVTKVGRSSLNNPFDEMYFKHPTQVSSLFISDWFYSLLEIKDHYQKSGTAA